MSYALQALEAFRLMSHKDVVLFRWESRDSSLLAAQRWFLTERGGHVGPVQKKDLETKHPTAPTLLVVTGVVAISSLADAIVRAMAESQRGGLVIDVRSEEVKLLENVSLEQGQLLIVKPHGEVISYTCQPGSTRDLAALIATPWVPSLYCVS
jgi:hypothetical protein